MTTDTKFAPTDDEIHAVVQACRERGLREFDVFRAVLAKWGQPAPRGEPVAWLSPWRADQVTTDYDAYGEHGIALYTAPLRRLHAENESLLTERERNLDSIRVNNEIINKKNAELETLRAKLKTYEDLGDAGSDVQLLRMGYAAARLEIESLRKEHANELTVAYMCGASWEKELAAQQPGASRQVPASSAVLKAIREANMQLVRTGDNAFMLVPYKVATAQAADSVPAGPKRKDMLWSTAKMQERHDQRIENIVSGLERIKQEHAGQQPQKIDECYGDCPTDSTTCTNPCRFDGRAARARQSVPAIQGETNVQLDIDSNPSPPAHTPDF